MSTCACMYPDCAKTGRCLAGRPELRYLAEPLPVYYKPCSIDPTAEELSHLRDRREEKAEEARTAGKWCLTLEGRAYLRELWGDDPECWTMTLLAEVERLERLFEGEPKT